MWGADVVLAPLNLCAETLDGIRNHSWSRPAPSTPEGEVVAWADRIAYVCHDFEDAVRAGIVTPAMLPGAGAGAVRRSPEPPAGRVHLAASSARRSTTARSGCTAPLAEALAEFRAFNYEQIYMRPASVAQGEVVVRVLRALVEFYADRPNALPAASSRAPGIRRDGPPAGSPQALREAVTYVAGMTDRFAFAQARAHLGLGSVRAARRSRRRRRSAIAVAGDRPPARRTLSPMGILDEDIARVREATDIVGLIGEHVALKRAGGRFTGLCPFHGEKTASFSVNPQLGFYYCFGCQESGDAITFIRKIDGLDFAEAVERLAVARRDHAAVRHRRARPRTAASASG